MHSTSVLSENGLRHEGGVDTVLQGDFLDDETVGHGAICHGEGVCVSKIDFVLTGCTS